MEQKLARVGMCVRCGAARRGNPVPMIADIARLGLGYAAGAAAGKCRDSTEFKYDCVAMLMPW